MYGATFQMSVPSTPRPYWPFDLTVNFWASAHSWPIVVGGPDRPAPRNRPCSRTVPGCWCRRHPVVTALVIVRRERAGKGVLFYRLEPGLLGEVEQDALGRQFGDPDDVGPHHSRRVAGGRGGDVLLQKVGEGTVTFVTLIPGFSFSNCGSTTLAIVLASCRSRCRRSRTGGSLSAMPTPLVPRPGW